jgi:hypothetical protein
VKIPLEWCRCRIERSLADSTCCVFLISACNTCTLCFSTVPKRWSADVQVPHQTERHLNMVVTAIDPHTTLQPLSCQARRRVSLRVEKDKFLPSGCLHTKQEKRSYSPISGGPSATPTRRIQSAWEITSLCPGRIHIGVRNIQDHAIPFL